MKRLSLLAVFAILAACAESPTQPDIQPSLSPAASPLAARNPAGTGQPGAECESIEPPGFSTGGFANAESKYAGSDGTPSLANANSSHAVSQYDVACFQISSK